MAVCCEADVGKQGLSRLSSLLVDFGTFALVAVVARVSFRGLLPKVVAQRTKETTSFFSEQQAFHEAHEKDHAALAKAAKGATESPPSRP